MPVRSDAHTSPPPVWAPCGREVQRAVPGDLPDEAAAFVEDDKVLIPAQPAGRGNPPAVGRDRGQCPVDAFFGANQRIDGAGIDIDADKAVRTFLLQQRRPPGPPGRPTVRSDGRRWSIAGTAPSGVTR